jgi:hypothetical protein
MLTLLIEICLISKAWKKGWRGWALLPVAIGWAFCFMVGLAVGATGGSADAVLGISLLAEVGIITVLAVMAVKERQPLPASTDGDMTQANTTVLASAAERTAA